MSVFAPIDDSKLAYIKKGKGQNVGGLLKCGRELTKSEVE